LLDVADIPAIYEMPPWDVRKNTYRVGGAGVVKNMPVINANIARHGVKINPLDVRYNTFSTATKDKVNAAYFVHYVCQQIPQDRNQIKARMIQGEPSKQERKQPRFYSFQRKA
jgi:hypothetical protein